MTSLSQRKYSSKEMSILCQRIGSQNIILKMTNRSKTGLNFGRLLENIPSHQCAKMLLDFNYFSILYIDIKLPYRGRIH